MRKISDIQLMLPKADTYQCHPAMSEHDRIKKEVRSSLLSPQPTPAQTSLFSSSMLSACSTLARMFYIQQTLTACSPSRAIPWQPFSIAINTQETVLVAIEVMKQ